MVYLQIYLFIQYFILYILSSYPTPLIQVLLDFFFKFDKSAEKKIRMKLNRDQIKDEENTLKNYWGFQCQIIFECVCLCVCMHIHIYVCV